MIDVSVFKRKKKDKVEEYKKRKLVVNQKEI